MPHKDPEVARACDRERFRRRTEERLALGLCRAAVSARPRRSAASATLRPPGGTSQAAPATRSSGPPHATPGSGDGAHRRAGPPQAADRQTHRSRPVHQVRQGPAGAGAPAVRRLHRETARGRTEPLCRRQGCRQALRRRQCPDAPPQCQDPGNPAPQAGLRPACAPAAARARAEGGTICEAARKSGAMPNGRSGPPGGPPAAAASAGRRSRTARRAARPVPSSRRTGNP